MKNKLLVPFFLHGGDYNPEQWKYDKKIWQDDMRLMKEARCNTMTMGVFSWSELEPEECNYDFSVFDEVIDLIYRNGGKVILATPSGARPHWLADKYPEVLRTKEDGTKMRFGGRHNHCYTSPIYREKVRMIDEKLAERYGNHPAVIGWHISNEYSGECYCPLCKKAFREFLKNKYKTIDALNHEYWTQFWSHTYNNFEQIDPPGPTGEELIHGLNLDWRRFVTSQTVDFLNNEISAVKKYSPNLPVTTNMMTGFYGLDYYKFADSIDIASWDDYPDWNGPNQNREATLSAFWHDFFRSLKRRPYLLMESAPGCVNWKEFNKLKRPDMEKLSALQAIAHGSDSVLYFQWRKSRGCSEKFHGAVVDHIGTDETRIFKSVTCTGVTLEKIGEIVGSDATPSEVAVLFDWENMWAFENCRGFMRNKNYREDVLSYYKVLWERAIPCDIVNPHDDLSRYKFVIAVQQYMTDLKVTENLTSYVENGGILLASCFLGMVNENDLCHTGGFPGGKLKEVFGIINEESDTLYPSEEVTLTYKNKEYKAKTYCELLHLRGAKALGEYRSEFYFGMPCVTVNEYGKGKAYYQAFWDFGDAKEAIVSDILREANVKSCLPEGLTKARSGLTAHKRVNEDNEYLFIENYSDKEIKDVLLETEYTDMESGEKVDSVTMKPFGVRILKKVRL